MNIFFVLFKYFPYGGLERDMLAIARVCHSRGHKVKIYTTQWQGPRPDDIAVEVLPVRGLTNHRRNAAFAKRFEKVRAGNKNAIVVGFNKMPGLDFYYAADVCFAEKAYKERTALYRMMPRSRTFLALEKSVFAPESKTQVLIISKTQIGIYRHYYQTPEARMHLLLPGIRRECIMPINYVEQRQSLRAQHQLNNEQRLVLFVGSDYKRKGLDRALQGIAALDESLRQRVQLWVIGQDEKAPFEKMARTLGIEKNVYFLGARDDVPQLMWSADLLIHPAYTEAAGLVLLEAAVAGLPVICSAACGYANHIQDNNLGGVLAEPITPDTVAKAITGVFNVEREVWRKQAEKFAQSADIFSMPVRVAELIEAA